MPGRSFRLPIIFLLKAISKRGASVRRSSKASLDVLMKLKHRVPAFFVREQSGRVRVFRLYITNPLSSRHLIQISTFLNACGQPFDRCETECQKRPGVYVNTLAIAEKLARLQSRNPVFSAKDSWPFDCSPPSRVLVQGRLMTARIERTGGRDNRWSSATAGV
jgi:hypothetical protein